MSEEKSCGLNYRHNGKYDSHCRRTLCVNLAHKECVGHIVKACHQHGDDGGERHGQYYSVYWGLRQECIVVSFHEASRLCTYTVCFIANGLRCLYFSDFKYLIVNVSAQESLPSLYINHLSCIVC